MNDFSQPKLAPFTFLATWVPSYL